MAILVVNQARKSSCLIVFSQYNVCGDLKVQSVASLFAPKSLGLHSNSSEWNGQKIIYGLCLMFLVKKFPRQFMASALCYSYTWACLFSGLLSHHAIVLWVCIVWGPWFYIPVQGFPLMNWLMKKLYRWDLEIKRCYTLKLIWKEIMYPNIQIVLLFILIVYWNSQLYKV